jgi:hypothetical protein
MAEITGRTAASGRNPNVSYGPIGSIRRRWPQDCFAATRQVRSEPLMPNSALCTAYPDCVRCGCGSGWPLASDARDCHCRTDTLWTACRHHWTSSRLDAGDGLANRADAWLHAVGVAPGILGICRSLRVWLWRGNDRSAGFGTGAHTPIKTCVCDRGSTSFRMAGTRCRRLARRPYIRHHWCLLLGVRQCDSVRTNQSCNYRDDLRPSASANDVASLGSPRVRMPV